MKLKKGTSHNNLFDKELFTFDTLSSETNGEYTAMTVTLQEGGSAGAKGLFHIHPKASETFTVVKGKIAIKKKTGYDYVIAGETTVVPPNMPHVFFNAFEGETIIKVIFTPALNTDLYFANFAAARAMHPEWFKDGKLPLRFIARLSALYPDVMYYPSIPVGIQKFFIGLIFKIFQLLYGKEYMKMEYEE